MAKTTIHPTLAPGYHFKNRIINGEFEIDQRNEGATLTINSTANTFGPDHWFANGHPADGVFTFRRNGSGLARHPQAITCQVTTADASIGATQIYNFRQRIEGTFVKDLMWGTASARTITVSFWAKSSMTGAHAIAFSNADGTRYYATNYTINAGDVWEKKSITVPGDTSGGWDVDNDIGIQVLFNIGTGYTGTGNVWSGSTVIAPTGSVHLISTLNANLNITGVQFEIGSVATDYEVRPQPMELSLCQRYCEKSYSEGTAPGVAASAGATRGSRQNGGFHCSGTWKVIKRGGVTITFYSTATGASGVLFNNQTGGSDSVTTYSAASNGYDVVGTTATVGHLLSWQYLATSEI